MAPENSVPTLRSDPEPQTPSPPPRSNTDLPPRIGDTDQKVETTPRCPYCNSFAQFHKTSHIIYGGKDFGPVWVCRNYPTCDSYVGTHRHTNIPKGTLANKTLRIARLNAHKAFDPLWQGGTITRNAAYTLLAKILGGVSKDQAHIGCCNLAQCQKIIEYSTEKR